MALDYVSKTATLDTIGSANLLVSGPAASGKTSTLRTIAISDLTEGRRICVIETTRACTEYAVLDDWMSAQGSNDAEASELLENLMAATVPTTLFVDGDRDVMAHREAITELARRDQATGVRVVVSVERAHPSRISERLRAHLPRHISLDRRGGERGFHIYCDEHFNSYLLTVPQADSTGIAATLEQLEVPRVKGT
jgi:hypothetical protein